jgi:serine/threonine protein phosphatase PrpC
VLQDQGGREYNEDRFMAHSTPGVDVFGVFDGHNGSAVADVCARAFPSALLGHGVGTYRTETVDRLRSAFAEVDATARRTVRAHDIGSTACVLVLTPTDAWVANVGDSRAVLRTRNRTAELSVDHKPDRPGELRRIRECGGYLTRGGDGCYRIMGGLNLSRAIGDWAARPMVIATPDVVHHRRRIRADAYIVIASDGVWDVMSNAEVTDVFDRHAHTRNGITAALQTVLLVARSRGSSDNVTILYLGLLGPRQLVAT